MGEPYLFLNLSTFRQTNSFPRKTENVTYNVEGAKQHDPRAYSRVEQVKGASVKYTLALHEIIRLDWKGQPGTNT